MRLVIRLGGSLLVIVTLEGGHLVIILLVIVLLLLLIVAGSGTAAKLGEVDATKVTATCKFLVSLCSKIHDYHRSPVSFWSLDISIVYVPMPGMPPNRKQC